ncbi:MAG: transglycosylase domain-containing protein [Chitinophagales bacterium]|nr:transglycosylase domain-containing protein [Chitinophagales bacterium]
MLKLAIKAGVAGLLFFLLLLLFIEIGVFGKLPTINHHLLALEHDTNIVYADGKTTHFLNDGRRDVAYSEISPFLVKVLLSPSINKKACKFFFPFKIFYTSKLPFDFVDQLEYNRSRNIFERFINTIKKHLLVKKVSRKFSQEEIITYNLNHFEFLFNAKGIYNASQTYFSKKPSELNFEEAVVLVSMMDNPEYFNPKLHPENAIRKRNATYHELLYDNLITQEAHDSLCIKPILLNFQQFCSKIPKKHVNNRIVDQAQEILNTLDKSYQLQKDGLNIYTSIHPILQEHAESAVKEHLSAHQKILDAQYKSINVDPWQTKNGRKALDQIIHEAPIYLLLKKSGMHESKITKILTQKHATHLFVNGREIDTIISTIDSIKIAYQQLTAGMIVLENGTGNIVAYVGGTDFQKDSFDNCCIKNKKTAGSIIKTMSATILIEKGYSPCEQIKLQNKIYLGNGQYWTSQGGSSRSIINQISSPSSSGISILNEIKTTEMIALLRRMGVSSSLPNVPSINLGACDISLWELTKAYSIFPNHGALIEPTLITKIEDRNGKVIWAYSPEKQQVLNDTIAYIMTNVLKAPISLHRIKSTYQVPGEIAGKTGSTQNQANGWFIGFTPQYTCGVWVGTKNETIHFLSAGYGQGAAMALPVWAIFFNKCYADRSLHLSTIEHFPPPNNKPYDFCKGKKAPL